MSEQAEQLNSSPEIPRIEVEDTETKPETKPPVATDAQSKPDTKGFINPYSHVSSYALEATTVPPYVLYGIAKSAKKEKTGKSTKKDKDEVIYQDPFISSLGDNWSTFFHTVDSTPAFADGVLYRDAEALKDLPDLEGNWGGGERLKRVLNNEGPNPYERSEASPKSWLTTSSSSADSGDYTKRKSKAKYWMSTEKREQWGPYLSRVIMFNNYVPLFFRVFTVILSLVALALSVRIFRISKHKVLLADNDNNESSVVQQPSTLMAICVQSIGLIYLLYISHDEFHSKPLGIRNPVEKIRLILLDLLFIIFSSANLALSFNTLYDSRWVCAIDDYSLYPRIENICHYQKALCAFLFVILVTWVVTFSISIMRVILKVSSSGHS